MLMLHQLKLWPGDLSHQRLECFPRGPGIGADRFMALERMPLRQLDVDIPERVDLRVHVASKIPEPIDIERLVGVGVVFAGIFQNRLPETGHSLQRISVGPTRTQGLREWCQRTLGGKPLTCMPQDGHQGRHQLCQSSGESRCVEPVVPD